MNDFFESLRQQINERLNSPLLGAYAISWILLNYQVLVVLLSDLAPSEKINLIDAHLTAPSLVHILFGEISFEAPGLKTFGLPLLMALIYIFILPWPSRFALGFNLYMNKINKELKLKINNETPLTASEVSEMLSGANGKIEELEQLLERESRQAKRYKDELSIAEQRLQDGDNKSSERDYELKSAKESLKAMHSENATLNSQHEQLRKQAQQLSTRITELNKAEGDLAKSRVELDKFKRELDLNKITIEELRADKATLTRILENKPGLGIGLKNIPDSINKKESQT